MIRGKLCRQIFLSALALMISVATGVAAKETTLHSFTPYLRTAPSSLIADAAGNVYGFAQDGRYGSGMIVKVTTDLHGALVETVLYTFKGGMDGAEPYALVPDSSGNLFGLTQKGGTQNLGTFFELTPSAHGEWAEAILYNFTDRSNGILKGGLALDNLGNFYGTTDNSEENSGSVFQLSQAPTGWAEKVLHVFTGGADGGRPFGRLVFDKAGRGYGTASMEEPTTAVWYLNSHPPGGPGPNGCCTTLPAVAMEVIQSPGRFSMERVISLAPPSLEAAVAA